jgi:hypothetical protein
MKHTRLILALTLAFAAAACSKDKAKEGDKAGGDTAAKTTETAGPLTMSAADLWNDYGKHDGMKLLERYKNGVVVTGKVKSVGGDPADTATPLTLMLDVDGSPKFISLSFKDEGAAARAKKAGDEVTATCEVSGQSGNIMMLNDCVLK